MTTAAFWTIVKRSRETIITQETCHAGAFSKLQPRFFESINKELLPDIDIIHGIPAIMSIYINLYLIISLKACDNCLTDGCRNKI